MYKLVISELAHQDLDQILAYIAVQLVNPKAAGDFLDEVTACYHFLKENPRIYEQCQDNRLKHKGYRKAVIKNYVLVYKINEACQVVNILRFFYGGQDYLKFI